MFQEFGAALRFVQVSSKDWSRIDSCVDAWINFPASAIKRTLFLSNSSMLRRNREDSSSILRSNREDSSPCCDLEMPSGCEQHRWAPMWNYQIAQETDAQNGVTAEDV